MPESRRHRLARYAIVVAIFAVVGGIYVRREYFDDAGAGGTTAAASAGVTAAPTALASGPLAVDEPAPDFVLDGRDGPLRLSDFRGRAVLVNFWATWCGPCRYEMPELQSLYEAHAARDDLVVLSVNFTSRDSRSAAERYVDDFGFTFPLAFDVDGDVGQRYGVLGLPASFFVDADGILRARTYGPLGGELLTNGLAAVGVAGG